LPFNLKRTPIQLVDDNGEVVLQNALLVEGDGLCAIYDIEESHFDYIASFDFDLDNILATERLNIVKIDKEECLCSI